MADNIFLFCAFVFVLAALLAAFALFDKLEESAPMKDIRIGERRLRIFYRQWWSLNPNPYRRRGQVLQTGEPRYRVPWRPYAWHEWGLYAFGIGPVGFMYSPARVPCAKCHGIGASCNNSAAVPCDVCGGSGKVSKP
jgi:hypothetical protein